MSARRVLAMLVGCALLVVSVAHAQSDVPLTGAPFASFGPGHIDVTIAGTGLVTQPSSFDVVIPADATVLAASLYVVGRGPGDTEITLNGNPLTVPIVATAGPLPFDSAQFADTQRIDLTSMIAPGITTLTIEDYAQVIAGGGYVIAVYQSPSAPVQTIDLLDGADYAYHGFAPPFGPDTLVGRLAFPAAAASRAATLYVVTHDALPTGGDAIWGLAADSTVTPVPASLVGGVGGAVELERDLLGVSVASGGFSPSPQLDIFSQALVIPAAANYLAFQVESPPDRGTRAAKGDSIVMSAAVVALEADPVCGDGILDPGEECDPPNAATGCNAQCKLGEICSNQVDDDGDGLIDCLDPECTCESIGKDPGAIRFGRPGTNGDYFTVHGTFKPLTPINPASEPIGLLLTNANGVILRVAMEGADLKSRRHSFRYRNGAAKRARSGLYQLFIRYDRRRDRYSFRVNLYGDLSAATLARMAVQWRVGDDVFLNESDWQPSRRGWVLKLPGER